MRLEGDDGPKIKKYNNRNDKPAQEKEIEALNVSDEKLEEVAREKFGMTKEGEIIQKVITDTTSQQNDK